MDNTEETEAHATEPIAAATDEAPRSRRQSFRSSQARQVAVNFMPSRQLPYNTLRHRRNGSEHSLLLDETDGGEAAADDDVEDRKAEIIVKELEQQRQLMDDDPHSEELRREALRDLPQGLTMKRNVRAKLSASVSLRSKRKPISFWKRTKYRISFAWKRSKDRLHEALFSIELWYEAIRDIEGQFGSAVGSYFRMLRRLFVLNLLLSVFLVGFVVIPQSMFAHHGHEWHISDWVTGEGFLQETVMFFGHYHGGYVAGGYYMPYAYFFTMACLYLVFFAVLCFRTADSYRHNFIEAAGGLSQVFANKVFCGWDFGIVSVHAAHLNARSIYNELKELLNEQNKKTTPVTFCTKLCHTATNVCVTSLVLASIAGLLYAVWKLLEGFSHYQLSVSVVLASCVALCPVLFTLAGRLERYSARVALYVALVRAWLLQVALLLLLLIFHTRSNTQCLETRFGQQVYRLVLLDASVSLVVLPGIDVFRALLYKYRPTGSPPEFNIAYNSLTLLYNQSAVWLAMLFSPLLPAVVAVKFLFLFYVKRECAVRACQPARKVWRAAQTHTVLFMLVTLSLFITLFGIGSVFLRMASQECGPFREYANALGVLSAALWLERHRALQRALAWLARPAVLALAVLLLCVLVYYGRARARAHQSMVELLRHMLVLQAKDKDFLLNAIDKVSNGEWLYSPKPEEGPDTHTVRYLREVRKPSNSSFHFDGSRLSKSDRPRSGRPVSHVERSQNDGDTDSSFSWQGSANHLNNSA